MSALRLGGVLVAIALLAGCSFYDVDKARPYPCDPDAGDSSQCPGGARCGLSGFCHAIGVAGPYTCNSSADCEANEHCGVAHVCYDRLDAGAIACANDLDCAPDWRCGVGDQCILASGDSLRAPTPISALSISKVSPSFSGTPSQFTANYFDGWPELAMILDGGLVLDLQGDLQGDPPQFLSVPTRAPVLSLAFADESIFVQDTLGVWVFSWLDGGVAEVPVSPGGGPLVSAESAPFVPAQVFSLGADGLSYWDTLDLEPSAVYAADGGGSVDPASTLVALPDDQYSGQIASALLALTPRGVSVLYRDQATGRFNLDGGDFGLEPYFSPQMLPMMGSLDCAAPGPLPVAVRAQAGVAFEIADAGPLPQLWYYQFESPALTDCSPTQFNFLAAGDACPAGAELVDFTVPVAPFFINGPFTQALLLGDAICRTVDDAGVHDVWWDLWVDASNSDGGFERLPAMDPGTSAEVFASSSAGLGFALIDSEDRPASCDQYGRCSSAFISSPPVFVLGDHDAGYVLGLGADDRSYVPVPGLGFMVSPVGQVGACASVKGAPTWSIACPQWVIGQPNATLYDWRALALQGVVPITQLAILEGSSEIPVAMPQQNQPFLSSVVTTLDGRHELVTAASDRIFAGDVTALFGPDAGGLPVSCSVKSVPLPEQPITAFTAGPAPADAGLVDAYAITSGRLFHIRAVNDSRWLSDEVTIPDGVPSTLWQDGDRVRLGYADGRVFAFPSATQIGPALPESARQFASLCGSSYALSGNGLYQLTPSLDGGAVGSWSAVPLDWNLPFPNVPIDQGQLYETDDSLFLFDNGGSALQIVDPACD